MLLRDGRPQTTVRVLCNVVAGCSFGGLALLAEERRRRIAIAQKIVENGKRLQQYKTYHGIAPISVFESGVEFDNGYPYRELPSPRQPHEDEADETLTRDEWLSRGRKSRKLPTSEDMAKMAPPLPEREGPDVLMKSSESTSRPPHNIMPLDPWRSPVLSSDHHVPIGKQSWHRASNSAKMSPAAAYNPHTTPAVVSRSEVPKDAGISQPHRTHAPSDPHIATSSDPAAMLLQQLSRLPLARYWTKDAVQNLCSGVPLSPSSFVDALDGAVTSHVSKYFASNDPHQRSTGLAELKGYHAAFEVPTSSPTMGLVEQAGLLASTPSPNVSKGISEPLVAKMQASPAAASTWRTAQSHTKHVQKFAPQRVSSLESSGPALDTLSSLIDANNPGHAFFFLVSEWSQVSACPIAHLAPLLDKLIGEFIKLRLWSVIEDLHRLYVDITNSGSALVRDSHILVNLRPHEALELCRSTLPQLAKKQKVLECHRLMTSFGRALEWTDGYRLFQDFQSLGASPELLQTGRSILLQAQQAPKGSPHKIAAIDSMRAWFASHGFQASSFDAVEEKFRQGSRFDAIAELQRAIQDPTDSMSALDATKLLSHVFHPGYLEEAHDVLDFYMSSRVRLDPREFGTLSKRVRLCFERGPPGSAKETVLQTMQREAIRRPVQKQLVAMCPRVDSILLLQSLYPRFGLDVDTADVAADWKTGDTVEGNERVFDTLFANRQFTLLLDWMQCRPHELPQTRTHDLQLYEAYACAGTTAQIDDAITTLGRILAAKPKVDTQELAVLHQALLISAWNQSRNLNLVASAWKQMCAVDSDGSSTATVLDALLLISLQARNQGLAARFLQRRLESARQAPSAHTYLHIAILHARNGNWDKVEDALHLSAKHGKSKRSTAMGRMSLGLLINEAWALLSAEAAWSFVKRLRREHKFKLSRQILSDVLQQIVRSERLDLLQEWADWMAGLKLRSVPHRIESLTLLLRRCGGSEVSVIAAAKKDRQRVVASSNSSAALAAFQGEIQALQGFTSADASTPLSDEASDGLNGKSWYEDSERVDQLFHNLDARDEQLEAELFPSQFSNHDPNHEADHGAQQDVAQEFKHEAKHEAKHKAKREATHEATHDTKAVDLDTLPRKLPERLMVSMMRQRDFEGAVGVYQASLVDGMPRQARDLTIAVQARLRSRRLDPELGITEAIAMIEPAEANGVDVVAARRLVRQAEFLLQPDISEDEAFEFIHEAYDEATRLHLRLDHHMSLAVMLRFLRPFRFESAWHLHERIEAAGWLERCPPDMHYLTLLMQIAVALPDRPLMASLSARICSGAHRVDEHYLRILKNRHWWMRKKLETLSARSGGAATWEAALATLTECWTQAAQVAQAQYQASLEFAAAFARVADPAWLSQRRLALQRKEGEEREEREEIPRDD